MKDLYKIMLTNVCYSTDLQCESLCIHGRSRTPVPTIKIQFTLVNPNLSYKLTKKVNAVALFFIPIGVDIRNKICYYMNEILSVISEILKHKPPVTAENSEESLYNRINPNL